ncbi:hypothetical protein WDV91_07085 [Curtobacterium flaccumfaciens pv. flaccumfaciens]
MIGDGGAIPPHVVVPAPVLPHEPDVLVPTIGTSNDELTYELLDGMLEAPIEHWMAFLDPAQAKLVRRSFKGPARIRGAASTGKTVVGLHRAAYLAHVTGGPVTVTSASSRRRTGRRTTSWRCSGEPASRPSHCSSTRGGPRMRFGWGL